MTNNEEKRWTYAGWSLDSETFVIDGIDVWRHPWEKTGKPDAQVKDPLYGQDYSFAVFEVKADGKNIRFAAGEFSNGVWGFYVLG